MSMGGESKVQASKQELRTGGQSTLLQSGVLAYKGCRYMRRGSMESCCGNKRMGARKGESERRGGERRRGEERRGEERERRGEERRGEYMRG
jgi:hypothetical protein